MRGGRWLVLLVAFSAVFAGANVPGDDSDAATDSTAWSTETPAGSGLHLTLPATWKRYKRLETPNRAGKTVLFEGNRITGETVSVNVSKLPARKEWSDDLDAYTGRVRTILALGTPVTQPTRITVGSYPAYELIVRVHDSDTPWGDSVVGWMDVMTSKNAGLVTIMINTAGSGPAVVEKIFKSVKPV